VTDDGWDCGVYLKRIWAAEDALRAAPSSESAQKERKAAWEIWLAARSCFDATGQRRPT
jgi:hypothetical protein